MRRPPRPPPGAAALLLAGLIGSGATVAAADGPCANGGRQNPGIAAGWTIVQRSPGQLGKRVDLANRLEKAGCFAEAVRLLEEGQPFDPQSPTLQFNLRRARDLVKEEHYLQGIDQAAASTRLNRKTERCTRERDVAACDEVLSQQPNNTTVLIAKGDALVQTHRLADAAKVYARAGELAPKDTALARKRQALQSQRAALSKRCTDGDGDAALQACKTVLVKGAPDEFATTVRIAMLQQSSNQTSQALDSYIAANSLHRGDKGVALAILALLQSTQRKDPIALAARGSALLTLGRAQEALAPLRQAKTLEPAMPDIDPLIKSAETLSRSEAMVRRERSAELAAVNAEAEAMVKPQDFSNTAEPTRSN